jgi:hypothetical protein
VVEVAATMELGLSAMAERRRSLHADWERKEKEVVEIACDACSI